jgi:HTH-type transcriptional repressor of NAD biosynthesis genes
MLRSKFKAGVVVGKFAPLHRGHEMVIAEAAAQCERLLVLSWIEPEPDLMPAAMRERWLRLRCPTVVSMVLDPARVAALCAAQGVQPVLPPPHKDAPDGDQREFVLWLCARVLRWPCDAVFTSEAYGKDFAAHMARGLGHKVRHVEVDLARQRIPISGTALRQALAAGRDIRAWVAPEVNADLVRRACLLGGESSGKSTLAKALAERLATSFVPEYGRELWEARGGTLMFSDLLGIAEEQLRREQAAAAAATGWLLCDTSPLTTLFYCLEQFGRADARLWALASHPYDRVLVCAPDFPFVQDGTRREAGFREKQHAWYLQALRERDVPFTVLEGSVEQREEQAMGLLRAGRG